MRRVRPGDVIAGVAGVLLLASMFYSWYEIPSSRIFTAWEAFSVVDVLLAVVALLGIALAASQVVGRGPTLPVALSVITTTLALAGTLLLIFRLLNQPGPNDAIIVRGGAWLGLAAVISIFLGAWGSLSDERPRPVDPPPPEPERRPTPARS